MIKIVLLDKKECQVEEMVWAYVVASILCADKDKDTLETCMYRAGIYFQKLPPEINKLIGHHLFCRTETSSFILNRCMMATAIHKLHPDIFALQLVKMLCSIRNLPRTPSYAYVSHWIKDCRRMADAFFSHKSYQYEVSIFRVVGLSQIYRYDCLGNKLFVHFLFRQGYLDMYQYVTENIRDDIEIATYVIQQEPLLLKYASSRLRDDTELVKLAISQDEKSLEYASERLQDDEDIVYSLYYNFEHVNRRWMDDYDFMLYATEKNTVVLQFTSPNLLSNRRFVLAAAQVAGESLEWFGDEFNDDEEIVLAATKSSPNAFCFASERLQDDYAFAKMAVEQNFNVFAYLNFTLRDNEDIVMSGLINMKDDDSEIRQFARVSRRLRHDRDFIKRALQLDGRIIKFCSVELRDDEELLRTAFATMSMEPMVPIP